MTGKEIVIDVPCPPDSKLLRAFTVFKIFVFTLPMLIFDLLLKKLGILFGIRKYPDVGEAEMLAPNVWSLPYYCGPAEIPARCIIYRECYGERLLVLSPPNPTPAAVAAVEALGRPWAAVTTSVGHDMHAHLWAEEVSGCRSAAFKNLREYLTKQNREPDVDVEELFAEFGISWSRVRGLHDKVIEYMLQLPVEAEGRRTRSAAPDGYALMFTDVVQNHVDGKDTLYELVFAKITGWSVMGMPRFFKIIGAASLKGVKSYILEVCQKLGPDTSIVALCHGPSFTGADCVTRLASCVESL
eukprot:GFYU01006065.1.p1 GENE.GFYU01006065.1~~GFYU01006065.1.p1  ORF type:complete len:306 (-),score=71.19 GFYU01006065.1:231-1127(-)